PDFWVFQKHRLDQLIESGKPVTFLNVTITTEMTSNSDFVQSLKRLNANWWVRDKQSADLLLGVDIQAKHMPDISCTLDIKNKQSNNKKLTVFLN
ncbi:hypothetical protein ACI4B7_26310, partial [Klebsiella pneumoniae]|uniref:hypothetical protein n=1 Tax=Klebsiella pneumoniae TaxID=573 RepID=UPI003851E5DB